MKTDKLNARIASNLQSKCIAAIYSMDRMQDLAQIQVISEIIFRICLHLSVHTLKEKK